MQKPLPIITAIELKELLTLQNIILIDAGSGAEAEERYSQIHIVNAHYVDLNSQLSNIGADAALGGRHPLPMPKNFAQLLGNLGITPETHVVIYDDKKGVNAAARFWWMLRSAGHTQVQVLNGGLQAAINAGIETTNAIPETESVNPYPFTEWQLPLKVYDEVSAASENNNFVIIDVRESERYQAITEPIDPIAGHIPNAINIPLAGNLQPNGEFASPEEICNRYSGVFQNTKPENIIVHCGSGVTACHTLLALDYAGYAIPSLYVGSWSEWCRRM